MKTTKRFFTSYLCIALQACLSLGMASSSLAADEEAPVSIKVEKLNAVVVGKKLPSFAAMDSNGKLVTLNDVLKPQADGSTGPVVISFFASWCKPCKRGLPVIQNVTRELAPTTKVRSYLVSYQEEEAVVSKFLGDSNIQLPVLMDRYLKVAGRLGVDGTLPKTFVIDAAGNVRTIFAVEGADFTAALTTAIQEASVVLAPSTASAAPVVP